MERHYSHNERAEVLGPKAIARMKLQLLEPALAYCIVNVSNDCVVVYSKESEGTSRSRDGIDYYYSFHATECHLMPGDLQYTLTEEVTENMALGELTYDECNNVRLRFQQNFIAAGHQLAGLSTSSTWQALLHPEVFPKAQLAVATTKAYVFHGDEATTSSTVELQLKVRDAYSDSEEVTILDTFHLDDKALAVDDRIKEAGWEPEDFAVLDVAGENLLELTTKDQENIIMIMNDLQLLSQNQPSGILQRE